MSELRQALTRSVAEECGAARAVPYSTTRYDAFRISESGRTYAVQIDGFLLPTVEAARDAALLGQAFAHKDHLLIRESGDQGVKLHLFAIKRKATPRYVHQGHVTRAVHDLYAAPVCTMDGGVLLP
jgi:hypothetical protein